MSRSRTEEVEDAERASQVLELRKAGMTFPQIARSVVPPYADHTGALRAYQSAMEKLIVEPAKEIRALEVARLDTLWATWYPKAVAGNGAALDRCLRLMERRAKLLGLDAPTQVNHTVSLEQQAEIERLAAELGVIDPTKNLGELEAQVIPDDEP